MAGCLTKLAIMPNRKKGIETMETILITSHGHDEIKTRSQFVKAWHSHAMQYHALVNTEDQRAKVERILAMVSCLANDEFDRLFIAQSKGN